jgi:hypothetical protein
MFWLCLGYPQNASPLPRSQIASTVRVGRTRSCSLASMECLRVAVLLAQPPQAPLRVTRTRSPSISNSSTSPPSARRMGRISVSSTCWIRRDFLQGGELGDGYRCGAALLIGDRDLGGNPTGDGVPLPLHIQQNVFNPGQTGATAATRFDVVGDLLNGGAGRFRSPLGECGAR